MYQSNRNKIGLLCCKSHIEIPNRLKGSGVRSLSY